MAVEVETARRSVTELSWVTPFHNIALCSRNRINGSLMPLISITSVVNFALMANITSMVNFTSMVNIASTVNFTSTANFISMVIFTRMANIIPMVNFTVMANITTMVNYFSGYDVSGQFHIDG